MVAEATDAMVALFKEDGYWDAYNIFIVPQQCFLYVEVQERRNRTDPRPPITKSSTTHTPLGRIRYTGRPKRWVHEPYHWSCEFWDHERNLEEGTPEYLMSHMIVVYLNR